MKEFVEYATVFIEHENFYFIPANPLMNNKEVRYLLSDPQRCYAFRELLEPLDYDYVIIDMAPSMDIFWIWHLTHLIVLLWSQGWNFYHTVVWKIRWES